MPWITQSTLPDQARIAGPLACAQVDNAIRKSFMAGRSVEAFLRLLKSSPSGAVFNPWWQVDEENDIQRSTPRIRRDQLCAYLNERLGTARLAVIGEALGYRGGHFSGIPMTSERILRGGLKSGGSEQQPFFSGMAPRRTSKPEICPQGFSEPTATIVWSSLLGLGLAPNEFVLWNAFPWHSFNPRAGMLSNRTPNKIEQSAGNPVLKQFLALFPCHHVVALGQIAAAQLNHLGVSAQYIRHPASGGAKLFREQIARIVAKLLSRDSHQPARPVSDGSYS
jgi:uracil-DNA glycosylase